MSDDDLMDFADEDEAGGAHAHPGRVWRVLIVDDEPDVHVTTKLALADTEFFGRRLEFLDAYSGAEAQTLLEREPDIAVILLDVVMESVDSGLKLVRVVRDDLELSAVRIILRTGQPGYAPEMDAVRDYDINDYKTKGDLTRNKLFASLTSAIRSYQQIHALDASRRGLEMILEASSRLMAVQGLYDFAVGVITQLAALLQVTPEGLVCAQTRAAASGEDGQIQARVVAGAGHFRELMDRPLDQLPQERVRVSLEECLRGRRSLIDKDRTVLFFGSTTGQDMAVYLDLEQPLDDFNEKLIAVFVSNIAACFDNIRLFNQLNASAYVDSLTGLPNRVALSALLDQALLEAQRETHVLLLADISRFSELNQVFGHGFGDAVLKAFAARLTDRFGGQTVVARVGGDTFALLGARTALTPERVTRALEQPLPVAGRELAVQAMVGVLPLVEAEGQQGNDALKDANIALQVAKRERRDGHCYYSREMAGEIRERVRLLDGLRAAFDSERLRVVYQPQVALADGKVVGVEALLRWRLDDGEYVPPDRFIPLAEYSGLIVALGEWVLRSACRDAVRLHQIWPGLRMAVNLSVAQLRSPLFGAMLERALADTGISPANLELEITESMAMHPEDDIAGLVARIKRQGISVAIDDFGTGFSSLAYLEELGVDRLKIDKAFVSKLTPMNCQESVAATVAQLARQLKLQVIAEGVENDIQRDCLRGMRVDEAQGWLFAKGMPVDELETWLKNQG